MRLLAVFFLSLCLTSSAAQQDATGRYSPPAQHSNTPNQSSTAPASSVSPAPNQAGSAAGPTGFVLLDGTPVKLRINRTVSSADAHVGDTVDFEVLEEVPVNGTIVVSKGGTAFATVTEAQAKRRMARGGKLDINIDYIRLADEEKAALRAVKEVQGGGHTGAMTGAIVATSLVFFPAAPFFLFMHGKDITIPKGTELTAYVNGDLKLDIAKFQPRQPTPAAPVAAELAISPAAASYAQAQVQVTSAPDGADIEIDGIFVGDTPSAVGVASGQHDIAVKKTGFKLWERKIAVSSGQVHVNAVLEPDAK
jgi:hypothetical protein